jgi:hypothetical protein
MVPQLTDIQRAELETMGAERVRLKVVSYAGGNTGPESFIPGFACGQIRRDAIDDWLAEKQREEIARQARGYATNLRWTKIAAWAAIASVLVATVGVLIAVLGFHL